MLIKTIISKIAIIKVKVLKALKQIIGPETKLKKFVLINCLGYIVCFTTAGKAEK